MAKEETPILPQAAAFLVISYLVYRFFFTSSPSNSPSSPPQSARRNDPARLRQQVEAVHGMFPQFSQAAVEAELIRNGGSIEVATERILSTGFLPEPPQSTTSTPVATTSSRHSAPPANSRPRQTGQAGPSSSSSQLSPQYPDLITRYNLHSRLAEKVAEEALGTPGSGSAKGKAPASKHDRQLAHKAKRDEMILAARCRVEKMIAKERS
ncbi:hypothetical protein BDD12DRAFT_979705 [Trichophaea hybrida]|nr:hypothetical protein BDD12DRAFT_979705 [Trichophaea hybrida]